MKNPNPTPTYLTRLDNPYNPCNVENSLGNNVTYLTFKHSFSCSSNFNSIVILVVSSNSNTILEVAVGV